MNARCITAGFATVEVEVMSLHSRPRKFTISTQENKIPFVFQGKNSHLPIFILLILPILALKI